MLPQDTFDYLLALDRKDEIIILQFLEGIAQKTKCRDVNATVPYIAKGTRMGRTRVQKALAFLMSKGYIARYQEHGERGYFCGRMFIRLLRLKRLPATTAAIHPAPRTWNKRCIKNATVRAESTPTDHCKMQPLVRKPHQKEVLNTSVKTKIKEKEKEDEQVLTTCSLETRDISIGLWGSNLRFVKNTPAGWVVVPKGGLQ